MSQYVGPAQQVNEYVPVHVPIEIIPLDQTMLTRAHLKEALVAIHRDYSVTPWIIADIHRALARIKRQRREARHQRVSKGSKALS